jgi:hypothetical protein
MTDFETHPIGTAARLAQMEAAMTQSRAETAAAYERAATVTEWTAWGERHNLTEASRRAIRALATPDQSSALAGIEYAAEARGMRKAAEIAETVATHYAEQTYKTEEGRLQHASKVYGAHEIKSMIIAAIPQGEMK